MHKCIKALFQKKASEVDFHTVCSNFGGNGAINNYPSCYQQAVAVGWDTKQTFTVIASIHNLSQQNVQHV